MKGESKLNFKKAFIYCITLFSFVLNNFTYSFSQNTETEVLTEDVTEQEPRDESDFLGLVAESAILIDADTGVVLYEKSPDKRLYPASITKILTSLLTLENCKLDEKIKHSHEAIYGIGPGSSHIGMRENEEITVEQALYGILLASANEVCVAVAEHIGGNTENFMKMANDRLKKIGATNTHFANPHGFHDDNHYTTARDMSLIMKEAIKNEEFVKIISTYTYKIPPTNIVNEERILHNSNKFINPYNKFYYEYCVGGKTGFTDQAGNTLVTYAKKDGINLISVVMKDQGTNTYVDSKKLMEYGFEMFEEKELFKQSEYVGISNAIQVFHDKKIDLGKISVIPEGDFKAKVPKTLEKNKISTKIELPEEINGPIKIGDVVGKINLIYNDDKTTYTIGEVNLISNTKIDTIPEETLQEQENMEIFWENTLRILAVVGIIVGVIVIGVVLFILIKKYRAGKNTYKFK